MMYIATKQKWPNLKIATTALINIRDSFLLQPHVQLLILYTFSYLKRMVKSQLGDSIMDYSSSNDSGREHIIRSLGELLENQNLSYTTTAYNYNIGHLLMQYIFIKISDFIYQSINVDPENPVVSTDFSSKVGDLMKTFGQYEIDSIDRLYSLLPFLFRRQRLTKVRFSVQCGIVLIPTIIYCFLRRSRYQTW